MCDKAGGTYARKDNRRTGRYVIADEPQHERPFKGSNASTTEQIIETNQSGTKMAMSIACSYVMENHRLHFRHGKALKNTKQALRDRLL